ncbi:hypothetical protein BDF19DRAFT_284148 [Syncephalis fuscata]|nr:hypothetical protein BDF19DRAFT_284148 [Syncephalis fuscata]
MVAIKSRTLFETMPAPTRAITFRCWNDYFSKADSTEQSSICQVMIRVATAFPSWPILKWSILLDGLANHLPPIKIGGMGGNQTTTSDASLSDSWTPSNEENIPTFLLTLAYRMLARKVPIPASDLCTLKYLTLIQMGFRDCFVRRRTQDVQFGRLDFDPRDLRQRAVIQVCVAGMNELLDIYHISRTGVELRENSDIHEDEIIGTSFIDILLQLYNSQVDLTQLEDTMLRTWIESVTLITHKCNVNDSTRMDEIADIVKQLALLLDGPISADNQLLIISTFSLVLHHAPNIIAAALWRVVCCVGALLTRLRNHTHNTLFNKARYFLSRAICKFSDSGIFLLIFKNSPAPGYMIDSVEQLSPDIDMLFVLKTVITDIERHPPDDYKSSTPLREKPVQDVLTRIFTLKTLEKSGVSRILYNMSRYIKVTYPLPFSDHLATEYISFLNRLARHTANWDPVEFNIIPVLSSAAVILQEHPYHFETMINASMTIFRHSLQRFELSRTVMINMIMAFRQLSKNMPSHQGHPKENPFASCILTEVESRLIGRSRMLASTAANCIEVKLDIEIN